jgi:DNA modification methylase
MQNANFINQVILDDCLNTLSKLESNSVDLILTDPPYLISRDSNFLKGSTNKKFNVISIDFGEWDKQTLNFEVLFQEWKRVLKGIYNYPICHGKERTEHPTQKPLELIKDLILKHSAEGNTILDTFGGSGTTAIAAIQTNRNYILVETEEKYVEITNQRIKLLNNSEVYK